MMKKNGVEIGKQYLHQLETYLEVTAALPILSNGSLNLSAIAKSANLPRQSLYKNPSIRKILESIKPPSLTVTSITVNALPIAKVEDVSANANSKRKADQIIHRLEQKNAALFSENMELRRQIKELKMEIAGAELMIESGRRVLF